MVELLFAHVDSKPTPAGEPDYLQARACPVCGEAQRPPTPYLQLPDFQFFGDDEHRSKRADLNQVQCRRCLALYMNPCYTPRGFAVLFADAGQSYGATELRPQEQAAWLHQQGLLGTEPATLLDVGCGAGRFLAALPDHVRGIGVDIDQASIDHARQVAGAPNRNFAVADFEQFTVTEPVHVITMFHVLEHLPNPIRVLQSLRALALPATRLLLEVPILEKAKTNDINGYLTPSHLTHFSRHSLRQVVIQAGWRLEHEEVMAHYNGFRVIAAPDSAAPCAFDGTDDHGLLLDYLADHHGELQRLHHRLQQRLHANEIVIRGGGMHTEMLYQRTTLFHDPQRRFHIVDGDPRKQGQSWRGIPISAPAVLATLKWNKRQMIFSSYGHQPAMVEEARRLGIPDSATLELYDHIRRY